MRRPKFIGMLGGALVAPLAVRADQMAMPVIGFLNSASAAPWSGRVAAFRQGLGSCPRRSGRSDSAMCDLHLTTWEIEPLKHITLF
jgi:hypothetical protein